MHEANGESVVRIPAPFFLALALTGCSTQVIPPAAPADPISIYLTDYGRHSSVILPSEDGGFDEYAFGDWDFFAQGKTGLPYAIRALLGSRQSTLGWRHIPATDHLNAALGAKRLTSIAVARSNAQSLRSDLETRFKANGQTPFPSTYSFLQHVHDNAPYWAGHNCNHVTAEWLRELGCEIRGPAIFSDFVVRPRRSRFEPAH